jgi:hypothetical protein
MTECPMQMSARLDGEILMMEIAIGDETRCCDVRCRADDLALSPADFARRIAVPALSIMIDSFAKLYRVEEPSL